MPYDKALHESLQKETMDAESIFIVHYDGSAYFVTDDRKRAEGVLAALKKSNWMDLPGRVSTLKEFGRAAYGMGRDDEMEEQADRE